MFKPIQNGHNSLSLLSNSPLYDIDITVCKCTTALYTLMIGIFAWGLESPRQLVIGCAVTVAAYGPFCILVHLAVSHFITQTELLFIASKLKAKRIELRH